MYLGWSDLDKGSRRRYQGGRGSSARPDNTDKTRLDRHWHHGPYLSPWAHGLMAWAHISAGCDSCFDPLRPLRKNFVKDFASKSSELAETRNFRYNSPRRSYLAGRTWPQMAYVSRSSSGDFPESDWTWQNLVSGRGEIWQFGFCQGLVGPGIHLGGCVLMSGRQKPNYS